MVRFYTHQQEPSTVTVPMAHALCDIGYVTSGLTHE